MDRDGVLTKERPDYIKTAEELELLPGIAGPLKDLRKHGFLLVLVTNQSAIGRGLTTHREMSRIHERLSSELDELGCPVDAIYYCPHIPEDGCDCRKPAPGLILRAASELSINVGQSWMIGDKDLDLGAARKAGCRWIKVQTNGSGLADAARVIVSYEDQERETGPI